MNRDYRDGFHLIDQLEASGLRYYPVGSANLVDIGDVCGHASGYVVTLTQLTVASSFLGVAHTANTAAEASADGVLDVGICPPLPQYRFIVPVEATDLITLAQVGIIYDVESNHGIDEADTPTTYWGLFVDAIDVSTEAVAAETFGYAIGHFVYLAA